MKVTVYNSQKDLKISKSSINSLIQYLLPFLQIQTDEIIIHFVSVKKICELHETFFDDPSQTDCITFPIDSPESTEEHRILGEVFVCPKTAIEYGKQNEIDPYLETSLYLVHGVLHLIGYDDLSPLELKKMKKQEQICIDRLKKENLLLKKSFSDNLRS